MFITALFMVVKRWQQSKCQSMGEWINKMWCIHSMEYYSASKKRESCHMLQHGWTWGHYSKWYKSAQKKTNSVWFHLYKVSKRVQFIEIESQMVVSRGRWKGEQGYCLIGTEFQIWKMKEFWRPTWQQCEYTLHCTLWSVHLETVNVVNCLYILPHTQKNLKNKQGKKHTPVLCCSCSTNMLLCLLCTIPCTGWVFWEYLFGNQY